ncbi:MAG: hypothetical protein KIS87_07305 [Phycisphaeraceae bacterium]|nr:hypothetical protein [Phycisphaeraceae bacterium]
MKTQPRPLRFLPAAAVLAAVTSAAFGQVHASPTAAGGRDPIPVRLDSLYRLTVLTDGTVYENTLPPPNEDGEGGSSRSCTFVSTHTDANFSGGTYVAQAGFAEKEILAASYVLSASQFPIRVDLMECIFATVNAVVTTTTHWSVLVWDGPPNTGILVAEFSSDGLILPHLIMPPGSNGVNIAVGVDPNDPEQIIITNASGTNRFSVGFRIDKHNDQTQNPCSVPPPSNRNAFPTTDVSGLAQPSHNWLWGLNCGPFGCPANGGWSTFAALPSYCRPSGDWVLRATWTSLSCQPGVGACCKTDGSCSTTTAAECQSAGGTYKGDGSNCQTADCPQPNIPCCFKSTGGCIMLKESDCLAAGGIPGPPGQTCQTYVCFPIGAACLPDGTCIDGVTPEEAAALGGVFQGHNTTCATTNCPEPLGAACFPNGFCLVLTEAQANAAGATWMGAGTNCDDNDGNGKADACEAPPECPADFNGDTVVNTLDFVAYLNAFVAQDESADFNGDTNVNTIDFVAYLNAFVAGCP